MTAAKSDTAYLTISEVSAKLDVPAHVLRFWESKFSQLKPMKRNGGRRYYRQADIQLLHQIQDLLYRQGYTIKGAQKALRQPASAQPASAQPDLPARAMAGEGAGPEPAAAARTEALALIRDARTRLDQLLAR